MGADFIISTILGISLFMLAGFLLVLYFVPTIVALYLKHPNKLAIILINVFLGWSVMGWVGVPLKPSTVLVFSVALGIAIDITIRFLINYKQELPLHQFNKKRTVIETIYSTGISIIYTSLVLIAGFIIFSFSGFGGTQALGWLTSLTLVTATCTNLVLLPALLITMGGSKKEKEEPSAQQIA